MGRKTREKKDGGYLNSDACNRVALNCLDFLLWLVISGRATMIMSINLLGAQGLEKEFEDSIPIHLSHALNLHGDKWSLRLLIKKTKIQAFVEANTDSAPVCSDASYGPPRVTKRRDMRHASFDHLFFTTSTAHSSLSTSLQAASLCSSLIAPSATTAHM